MLRYQGRVYDSKAIAAVAYGIQHPEEPALTYDRCSGGRARGQSGWSLHRLGFTVDGMPHDPNDWSQKEVGETVKAYFKMLMLELAGKPFNKSKFNTGLRKKVKRSKGAVEYKFRNLSAVLQKMEIPFIEGYLPSENYQSLLEFTVEDWLRVKGNSLLSAPRRKKEVPSNASDCFVDPPKIKKRKKGSRQKVGQVNWESQEGKNRVLGNKGEEFVMGLERRRLIEVGKPDLAKAVEWVSETQGDGLGYDIESFAADGKPIFIEVKTTLAGKTKPFFLSINEIAVSKKKGKAYRLYRVFDFARNPRVYELAGSLEETCDRTPTVFQALPASK